VKVLIDMNLSPRWAPVLVDAGFEAVHWSHVGRGNAPDVEIMAYAASGDFVVLTHDLDFGATLAITGGNGPSVIQIRADDLDPATFGVQVIGAIIQMEAALRDGALLTIDASRARVRLLPLRIAPKA